MRFLTTLFAGLLFGTGLILSGMANPKKVQNFLDIFGSWDPSLAFVMGGAILVTAPGFWLVQKRTSPFFHDVFQLPARNCYGCCNFWCWLGLGWFVPRTGCDVTVIFHTWRPHIRARNACGDDTC